MNLFSFRRIKEKRRRHFEDVPMHTILPLCTLKIICMCAHTLHIFLLILFTTHSLSYFSSSHFSSNVKRKHAVRNGSEQNTYTRHSHCWLDFLFFVFQNKFPCIIFIVYLSTRIHKIMLFHPFFCNFAWMDILQTQCTMVYSYITLSICLLYVEVHSLFS